MENSEIKERPLLFTGEMVRAILDGRKTQTRRIIKFKPIHEGLNFAFTGLEAGYYCTNAPSSGWVLRSRRGDGCWEDKTHRIFCPYGQPGDRLWVRETWHKHSDDDDFSSGQLHYRSTHVCVSRTKWHPSIFMPRWASRILLEVTDIRVERLQEITLADINAEGTPDTLDPHQRPIGTRREQYYRLWDSINRKKHPWESNPFVWVISFKVLSIR